MTTTEIKSINGQLGQIVLQKKRLKKKMSTLKMIQTKINRGLILGDTECVKKEKDILLQKYNDLLLKEDNLRDTRKMLKTSYNFVEELQKYNENIEKEQELREITSRSYFTFTNFLDFFR